MEATKIRIKDVVKELNSLIELDFDAIAAYESAINRLQSSTYKSKLAEFMQDHQHHVTALSAAVRELGGEPAKGADVKRILTQGKVVIANIVGDDFTMLRAMKSNEDQTNMKYEQAARRFRASARLGPLLASHLEDERRHRKWILATLQSR